jgi:hypothetical protein
MLSRAINKCSANHPADARRLAAAARRATVGGSARARPVIVSPR